MDKATPCNEPPCERLPPWNDLTNDQRRAICDVGEYWANENGEFGRDAAHAIYNKIRSTVPVSPPTLFTIACQQGAPTVETIARLLADMDAENMPNARRAEILAGFVARPNDDDRAWAVSFAGNLPEVPKGATDA